MYASVNLSILIYALFTSREQFSVQPLAFHVIAHGVQKSVIHTGYKQIIFIESVDFSPLFISIV